MFCFWSDPLGAHPGQEGGAKFGLEKDSQREGHQYQTGGAPAWQAPLVRVICLGRVANSSVKALGDLALGGKRWVELSAKDVSALQFL